MSPDVLLFDLDGTLVDSREDIAFSVNHTLNLLGHGSLSLKEVEDLVGDGVKQLLSRAMGLVDEKRLAEAVEIFLPHYKIHCVDRTHPYPEVIETLDALKGIPMGVVTNKPQESADKTLEKLGLSHYFSVVLGGDALPVRKPAPDPLWEAWRRLNGRRGTALMVGDSPMDVFSAQGAGVLSVAMTYGFRSADELKKTNPDWLLNSFGELLGVVGRG